jgi:hypothetical protein
MFDMKEIRNEALPPPGSVNAHSSQFLLKFRARVAEEILHGELDGGTVDVTAAPGNVPP